MSLAGVQIFTNVVIEMGRSSSASAILDTSYTSFPEEVFFGFRLDSNDGTTVISWDRSPFSTFDCNIGP